MTGHQPLTESDTRAKLIDPAIHARGWTEELIRREETAGAIELGPGGPRRRPRGRVDYVLRVKVTPQSQAVAVALIEAKAENLPPTHGLQQAKLYAACKRLNVPFVFSSNGHLFVEFDRLTKLTSDPRPLSEFPTPAELRQRYEKALGISLEWKTAAPLLHRYPGGEATRRYYQDAAIRAVLEKIARGEKRALLALATGSGKTFIAVNLLKRIADAGQLRRALFVCDRDELRAQGLAAFQNVFGSDAAPVSSDNAQKNARILVATYQTLGVDTDQDGASFLIENYPPEYFSHIVIDECHRSAWGKWSEVLKRNISAVQVGLTATPRQLKLPKPGKKGYGASAEEQDAQLIADNYRWFGEPAYEYDMAQGIEDGYLAACEVYRFDLFHDNKRANERETGLERRDLKGKTLVDSITGEIIEAGDTRVRDKYDASSFEDQLLLPERVKAMCTSLFEHMLERGGPEQKTIIFCARDRHADDVANEMNNLYATWCGEHNRRPVEDYAFKCTAAASGNQYLADLRGASRRYFVATTVDLLTTGVDVPCVRNIVFFKYVRSPIAFYQMVGRGTRLYPPDGKLMFRVYDYTDATRLFGEDFVGVARAGLKPAPTDDERPAEPVIRVEGIEVKVTPAGHLIVTEVDGQAMPVTVEEYRERLSQRLVEQAPDIRAFQRLWVSPAERQTLLGNLPDAGRSAAVVRELASMNAYDLYDVLTELGYGLNPRTREDRAETFGIQQREWLARMPRETAQVLQAIAGQFALAGTDGLENPAVFDTPSVVKAGGLKALRAAGNPFELLLETKKRMFAA